MKLSSPLRIGTRGSPLALVQANLVAGALRAVHGLEEAAVEIVAIRTSGDRIQDRPLAELLSGRSSLPGLMPQAQEVAPVLWFRPGIDSHVHDWVSAGAPMSSSLALSDVVHAGLVAQEVQAMADKLPKLFGMPISPDLRRRVLVPLWTGLAGITADHAHVHKV